MLKKMRNKIGVISFLILNSYFVLGQVETSDSLFCFEKNKKLISFCVNEITTNFLNNKPNKVVSSNLLFSLDKNSQTFVVFNKEHSDSIVFVFNKDGSNYYKTIRGLVKLNQNVGIDTRKNDTIIIDKINTFSVKFNYNNSDLNLVQIISQGNKDSIDFNILKLKGKHVLSKVTIRNMHGYFVIGYLNNFRPWMIASYNFTKDYGISITSKTYNGANFNEILIDKHDSNGNVIDVKYIGFLKRGKLTKESLLKGTNICK